jgi:hypothetical protein
VIGYSGYCVGAFVGDTVAVIVGDKVGLPEGTDSGAGATDGPGVTYSQDGA